MWHASVALLENGRPVPTTSMDRKSRRLAGDLALRLINGVGIGRTIEGTVQIAHHARRVLSPDELRRIDQDWLALPPIDRGG